MRELAVPIPVIEVTGTVADVRPRLERVRISVVPLRIGTRLRIYEMMAMGVPVVWTAIGAEGLPIRHDEDLLIAHTADEQVSRICALGTHQPCADPLVANALWHLREHCSCEAVAKCFLAQCPRRVAASQPSYAGQAV